MIVKLHLLRFYARVWDPETETNCEEPITVTKEQLRAAGLIGLSSKDIIARCCKLRGLELLDTGKAKRRTITFNLNALWDGTAGSEVDG